LNASEIIDFADCHSGATAAPAGRLNPYKLGIELYRHAERNGLDIFRLRRAHHDVTLLDELVDEEFAHSVELFAPRKGPDGKLVSWRETKERLLRELSNGGLPRIELVEDNHLQRGELLLRHHHDGRDLDSAAAQRTLAGLAAVWGRGVHLDTELKGTPMRHSAAPGALRAAS
jgi:stage V sporulation protein R